MKIIFLTHFFHPRIGGVEKHVMEIGRVLAKRGHTIIVITDKFEKKLKSEELINGMRVMRISYPKVKYIGILFIWRWLIVNRKLLNEANIVHIHDVFIWYFPLKLFFPTRKYFLTIHGLEWGNPFRKMGITQKKVAVRLANGSIGVGNYLKKYLKVRFSKIIFGAATNVKLSKYSKLKNCLVFLGRLDYDTGVKKFLNHVSKLNKPDVDFIGDGPLRSECEKYGTVHGFTDPTPFLKKAEYVVPGGYLAYIEAKQYGCKIITFANNELKRDYWKGIKKIKKFPTWDELAGEYLDLWGVKK